MPPEGLPVHEMSRPGLVFQRALFVHTILGAVLGGVLIGGAVFATYRGGDVTAISIVVGAVAGSLGGGSAGVVSGLLVGALVVAARRASTRLRRGYCAAIAAVGPVLILILLPSPQWWPSEGDSFSWVVLLVMSGSQALLGGSLTEWYRSP